jgi:hypothetical protein
VAKLATLVDAFTSTTLNTAVWNSVTAGQVALDTVRDLVTLNVPTASGTYNLGTATSLDATSSSLYAQLWPVQNGSAALSVSMKLDAGAGNAVTATAWGDGTFLLRIQTAGVFTSFALPTYDPRAHRWWRLSESGGAFTLATSPDGQTWTALATAPYTWDATTVRVFFQTGTSTTQPAGLTARIAHVNTLAGGDTYPKVSELQEPFTSAALTSVWNATTAGQSSVDTVNDQVMLNVATAAGTYYNLGSAGPYDATGSTLYAQVTPAPVGNGGITAAMKLDAGQSNAVQVLASSNGFFSLQVQRDGLYVSTPLPAYDPHAHRWWRLTENDSAFVFAASPDGRNWTDLATLTYTWPFTACQVYFQTGTTNPQPPGLSMTVAHVNTLRGGPLNADWPTIEDAWGPSWDANAGEVPNGRYVDVTNRTRSTVGYSRGRQYELDQVRAGEGSLTLANTDAALSPTNRRGPWSEHINPYQPYRRRAQWPPTRNMLTQVQATGGHLGGYPTGPVPDDAALFSDLGGVDIVATASAWRGSRVLDVTLAVGAPGNAVVVATAQPAVEAGTTYTHTMRVRNVAASGSVRCKPYVAWHTAGSDSPATYVDGNPVTLTGSSTAGWTAFTLTATAPANTAGMEIGLRLASESGSDAEIQVDGWQLERGSVATAWTCPGVWYPIFAGFIERWPSAWDMSGTYGTVKPTVVDSLALLSQVDLDDPLTEEINAGGPRFLFKLDDPSGSTAASDSTGTYPAAQIAASKYGAGSLTFGTEIAAADPVNGVFTGSEGSVVTLNNANPGSNTTEAATYLKLASGGITGPADPGLFTRTIAFRYTGPMPAAAACMWSAMDNQRAGGTPSGTRIYLYLFNGGRPYFFMTGPDGTILVNVPCGPTNCVDGNWHLVTFGFDYSRGWVAVSLDGHTRTLASTFSSKPTGIVGDNVGGYVDVTVGGGTTWNWQGQLAFAGEWPTLLDGTQISNLYQAWKNACAGESTDKRYARILRYSGYTGASVLEPGLTTSMGPAGTGGQNVVSALQATVETENGEHFVDRAGVLRFRGRSARYNATTPAFTFGERADLGEWPYEEVTTDFDPTHLSNGVAVTQQPTGQIFRAQDAASVTQYFPRTLTRTINSLSANECQDAAHYLESRYRQPATRISSLKLHPSAMPALWAVCLALELGTRVRVMRRPPGVPATQLDVFVEQMQWEFGDDGDAWLTLQCSPADTTPYGVFVPWYAAVASTGAAGATSIQILNRRNNTLPLAAQLAPGQRLVLGLGTGTQETVTVQSVSGTAPGWTSATVTFTTATIRAHTVNEIVSEPLPTGVTDPTTWDAAGRFDSVAFAY